MLPLPPHCANCASSLQPAPVATAAPTLVLAPVLLFVAPALAVSWDGAAVAVPQVGWHCQYQELTCISMGAARTGHWLVSDDQRRPVLSGVRRLLTWVHW